MAQSQQTGTAQEAGRPQPQTTVEGGGGPFIRHSQPGRAPQYNVTGTAASGIVTQPLVARPGYFRSLRVTRSASVITAGTYNIDAPYNSDSLITLRDAFGTPLITADGYSVAQVINTLSGSFGVLNGTNVQANLPSSTALPSSGQFSYSYALPFEFSKGYGVLSAANASLLPTLTFNLNSVANIYATNTGTPTFNTQVDSDFYWLPEGVSVAPPGLGTTRQWILQQANPTSPSTGSVRLQFPRLGGYLSDIVMVFRDATGARIGTALPTGTGRCQLYVDGVPLIDSTVNEFYDDMAISYGLTPTQLGYSSGAYVAASTSNLTGVLAISRRTSLNQVALGLLDTGEALLSTNPGTLLEFQINTSQTIGSAPATANILVGQVVPTGAVIQGLPEV